MRLLVTGAAGMLGQAIVARARAQGVAVRDPGRRELDILDADAVGAAIAEAVAEAAADEEGPDAAGAAGQDPRDPRTVVVVNCAAWTDVDGAEADPEAAHAVNATGAGLVARAAAAAGATVIHVSSDYVFAGDRDRPYVESDAPRPGSAYGRSKLAGEREVLGACPRHIVVRTSWLFGAGGRNFVDTMLALGRERDEVSVVADQVGAPTWTGHLAPALLELARRACGPGAESGGLYHVAAAGSCSWNALAREIFTEAGLGCRVLATSTDAAARAAPRPAFSVLASERPDAPRLPGWRAGLRCYLAERGALTGVAP